MHELKRVFIVRLIVKGHDSYFLGDVIAPHVINDEVKHNTAIFPTAERQVYFIEIFEYKINALICRIVNIYVYVFSH